MLFYESPRYLQQFRAFQIEPSYWRTKLSAAGSLKPNQKARDFFDPAWPYWVHRQANLRHIAQLVPAANRKVCCLLEILESASPLYRKFRANPQEYGNQFLTSLVDSKVMTAWLNSPETNCQPWPVDDRLPEDLTHWLSPAGWAQKDDITLYESEAWVRGSRSDERRRYWQEYRDLILDLALGESRHVTRSEGVGRARAAFNRYRRGVLCRNYSIESTDGSAPRPALYLIAHIQEDEDREEWLRISKVCCPIAPLESTVHPDELARFARRSYPYDLLDEAGHAWANIQGEEETYLALSSEEMQLLTELSHWNPASTSVPLFINGRAGSGKSTMLYYLFADYCHRQLSGPPTAKGHPLFLSYNDNLIKVARDTVKRLLSTHHRFSAMDRQHNIDSWFEPLESLLTRMLPESEKVRFREPRHVSYFRFCQLYAGLPVPGLSNKYVARLPKQLSADLCWHVIRTFIKGYWPDGYMGPAEYEEVPRKDRSVSSELYKSVYDSVWNNWYRELTTSEQLWDDQDLVRRVLTLHCYRPEYTALVCDEAQDFTRVELQLLMRLSLLCQYDLSGHPANLPLAFAGDPFQTLNPSGFRWEVLRRVFQDEITGTIDPTGQLKVKVNFQELVFNYRSKPPIVAFTNLILLWRRCLFDHRDLRPQRWWETGDGFHIPQKFLLGRHITDEDLREHIADTVVIVPCEERGEMDYIKRDPFLSTLYAVDITQPPRNVFSASAAKGLEFDRVVLYKFGEECPSGVWENLQRDATDSPVDHQHFFNKLYVAASRAMTYLFVVDTVQGEALLWGPSSHSDQLVASVPAHENWAGSVQVVSEGTRETLSEMKETEPLEVAKELERKGDTLGNPDLLRRAKLYYQREDSRSKADQCEARALRLEERFKDAGLQFLKCKRPDDAWRSFWEGCCWAELATWQRDFGQGAVHRKWEAPIIDFMNTFADSELEGQAVGVDIWKFSEFLMECFNRERLPNVTDRHWVSAVAEYARRLRTLPNSAFEQARWRTTGDLLKRFADLHFDEVLDCAGTCFYRASDYVDAAICWDKAGTGERHTRDYWRSKAEILAGSAKSIFWLEKLGEYDRIVEEWRGAGQPIDETWSTGVRLALEKSELHWELVDLHLRRRKVGDAVAAFEKAATRAPGYPAFPQKLRELVDLFGSEELWAEALDATVKYLKSQQLSERERQRLRSGLLRGLARSQNIRQSLPADRREEFEALVRTFQSSEEAWQSEILPEEVGAAIERSGAIVISLDFYEHFTNSSDLRLCEYARERWVVNKRRHIRYLQEFSNKDTLHEEEVLERRCRDWNIARLSPFAEYPDVTSLAGVDIKGLPANTVRHSLDRGILLFEIGDLEVRTNRGKRYISIIDGDAGEMLRVDLTNGLSFTGNIHVETMGDLRLEFRSRQRAYRGVVFVARGRLNVELRIPTVDEPIFIEMLP